MVIGPIPRIRCNESTHVNRPRRFRSATMASARTRPIPGNVINSATVAVFTGTRKSTCRLGDCAWTIRIRDGSACALYHADTTAAAVSITRIPQAASSLRVGRTRTCTLMGSYPTTGHTAQYTENPWNSYRNTDVCFLKVYKFPTDFNRQTPVLIEPYLTGNT